MHVHSWNLVCEGSQKPGRYQHRRRAARRNATWRAVPWNPTTDQRCQLNHMPSNKFFIAPSQTLSLADPRGQRRLTDLAATSSGSSSDKCRNVTQNREMERTPFSVLETVSLSTAFKDRQKILYEDWYKQQQMLVLLLILGSDSANVPVLKLEWEAEVGFPSNCGKEMGERFK